MADPQHPAKGPFSYSIEADIDNFKRTWNSSSSSFAPSTIISLDSKGSANNVGNNGVNGSSSINSIDTNKQPSISTVESQSIGNNLNTSKSIVSPTEIQNNNSITGVQKSITSGNISVVIPRRSRTLHSSKGSHSNFKLKNLQKNNVRRRLPEVSAGNVTAKDIGNNKSGAEVKVKVEIDGYGGEGGYIYELREDILHPLVDTTNPRLNAVCYAKGDGKNNSGMPSWVVKSCQEVRARNYFSPSEYTIAVHMWTHTFLGWSYFRGMYNSGVYADVERRLVPNMECPAPFIEGEK